MREGLKSVLITGGSGLLGSALTEMLLQKGYHVSHLVRRASSGKVKCFRWSVSEKYVDPKAFDGVDVIIHLAGAGVADKRWTPERKREILESRTKSGELLWEALRDVPNNVKVVLSANGIAYYGLTTADEWCSEDSKLGDDYLAQVTNEWAASIMPVEDLNKRLVIFRIGLVLSNLGGALVEMAKPVKWGVGAPLGSGQQWMSWIHIDDLCRMFLYTIEHENINGIFNAVAPNPVTNIEFTKFIAKALHRPLFLPAIPEWVMKVIVGEMYKIIVTGARVTCDKIKSTGFDFNFTNSGLAIKKLLTK